MNQKPAVTVRHAWRLAFAVIVSWVFIIWALVWVT